MQGKYRHELKYIISQREYRILHPRIKTIMHSDPHTDENGLYRIHSIYFDNYRDKALREKEDGVQKREKYRIRWYNDSKKILTLEKKMKINNLCMKFGRKLKVEELDSILEGRYGFLRDSGDEIKQEFYHRLTSEQLRPVVQVSYTREPFIYEFGNVRVTFDSRIKSSLLRHNFHYASPMIPTTSLPDQMIMEVKFDEYLPGIIEAIIQVGTVKQTAFSKYGICRIYG